MINTFRNKIVTPMNSQSPARRSQRDMLIDEKVLPKSNYFGGTFYSPKKSSVEGPIMMFHPVNDQKLRVIRSNKRDISGSPET